MGNSKKHKEKRDRKKHKRDRSRERDGHKKAHKSSHRREKRKSPEHSDQETEVLLNKSLTAPQETPIDKPSIAVEEDFDVDELLDSKLSENAEFSAVLKRPPAKKRRREGAIEELKRRQNLGVNEDSLEKFATEQMLEEHGVGGQKRHRSPSDGGARIKDEPREEGRGGSVFYLSL